MEKSIKKIWIVSALLLTVGACAHHDSKVEHHHHDEKQASFDGQCAYSIAQAELDNPGSAEFSLEHKGMTYYFSSAEKMDLFKKDLDKNVRRANEFWHNKGHGH